MGTELLRRPGNEWWAQHRDEDVYWLSVLQSVRNPQDQTPASFCGQLSRLANASDESGQGGFAKELLNTVSRFDALRDVDRVCLAGIVPHSNQLVAIDSACSCRIKDNLMLSGYSCFVDPEGSLLQMRPGMLRIFADTANVIASYRRESRPIQRSIAKTSRMGLRSGFCMAVGADEHTWGFLFMNSCRPNYFDGIEQSHATHLSALSIYAKSFLQSSRFGRSNQRKEQKPMTIPAEGFSPKRLLELLKVERNRFLPGEPKLQIKMENIAPFLCNHLRLAKVLSRIAIEIRLVQKRSDRDLILYVRRCDAGIVIQIPHDFEETEPTMMNLFYRRVEEICESSDSIGFQIHSTLKETQVRFPFEPLNPRCGERFYSTDEEASQRK